MMKLPTDRKDRIKVLALIGVGCCAALYGLFAGVLRPLSNKKKVSVAKIEELNKAVKRKRAPNAATSEPAQ